VRGKAALVAGGTEPAGFGPATGGLLGEEVASPAAVLEADQTEPEACDADPQPGQLVVVAQGADERQHREEGDDPRYRADRDRADSVDVERLDLSYEVMRLRLRSLGAAL
jgi:hypothetical protein